MTSLKRHWLALTRQVPGTIGVRVARHLTAHAGARVTQAMTMGFVFLATLGLGVLWKGTGYAYAPAALEPASALFGTSEEDAQTLTKRQKALRRQLARTEPKRPFIVVDRTHNRLFLKTNSTTALQAICSVGSGAFLAEPGGNRDWTFATPRGRFQVLSKLRNPVWKKPDWAFIEEGLPLPTDPGERFEYGQLGEFGLYFGDGYLIHGTLYERLLGRSVSHGCVRLGRDDLRALYAATRTGTAIYIF